MRDLLLALSSELVSSELVSSEFINATLVTARRAGTSLLLSASVAAAALAWSPPAAAGGCLVMPDGSCFVEPASLLPAGTTHERLDSGVELVLAPLPDNGRVAVEVLLAPCHGADELDVAIAWLLAEEQAGPAGEQRRARREALGIQQQLVPGPGLLRLRLEGPADALVELVQLEVARLSAVDAEQVAGAHAQALARADQLWLETDPDQLALALVVGIDDDDPASVEGLVDRFESHWRDARLVFAIAGDIDPDAALPALRDALDGLRGNTAPATAGPPAQPQRTEQALASLARSRVLLAWPDDHAQPGSRDEARLDLLRAMLLAPGGDLDRALVEPGLALRLGAPTLPGGGLALLAEVERGVAEDRVETTMDQAAWTMVGRAPQDLWDQLELARAHLLATGAAVEGPGEWAGTLGDLVLRGARPRAMDRRAAVLTTIGPDELLDFARDLLSPDRLRTVVLTPAPTAEADLTPVADHTEEPG